MIYLVLDQKLSDVERCAPDENKSVLDRRHSSANEGNFSLGLSSVNLLCAIIVMEQSSS